MYISQIEIKDIRSYERASLHLSPSINIIVGANNSGKSTIIKCAQQLQKSVLYFKKEEIRKTSETGTIFLKLSGLNEMDYDLLKTNDIGKIDFKRHKEINLIFTIHSGNKAQESYIIRPSRSRINLTDTTITIIPNKINDNIYGEKQQPFIVFEGMPNMENEDNFIYLFLAKRKTSYFSRSTGRDSAFGVYGDLSNLPAKIQKLSNISHPNHDEYKKYCEEILGFHIGTVPGESNSSQDELGLYVKSGDFILLESMGEGVVNILGLLAILLTENNKLFLIEELENDIHPEALKKLLKLILEKSSENQFIISTHSNIVLKNLASDPNAKVFYTSSSLKQISAKPKIVIPDSKVEELKNEPSERLKVLEKLGYELFDFELYKSYILFEESSAEQIVRDFLIPQFVPELINEVKTISAQGADKLSARFESFLGLFTYVHSNPIYKDKAWVIADGDDAGLKNINKLKEKFPTWPEENFINLSKANIEEYYPEQFREEYERIKTIDDRKERYKRKGELTSTVMKWIKEDSVGARTHFEANAAEIIEILNTIQGTLISE